VQLRLVLFSPVAFNKSGCKLADHDGIEKNLLGCADRPSDRLMGGWRMREEKGDWLRRPGFGSLKGESASLRSS